MDKDVLVHIPSGILLSNKRNPFESVLLRWTNLEPALQTSKSESKKQILNINAYIWNVEK